MSIRNIFWPKSNNCILVMLNIRQFCQIQISMLIKQNCMFYLKLKYSNGKT